MGIYCARPRLLGAPSLECARRKKAREHQVRFIRACWGEGSGCAAGKLARRWVNYFECTN